jgi:glutamine amidotransferase
MNKVAIIDYGLGNTFSIQNALRHIGYDSDLVTDPVKLRDYSHVILPGVGAFPFAMSILKSNGMASALVEHVRQRRPLLGICLGMQLLFSEGEENEVASGLNFLRGRVERFKSTPGYSIPQIQWNKVNFLGRSQMTEHINSSDYFYFLHSYCIKEKSAGSESIIGLTTYAGQNYVSFIQQDTIVGVQFHPEKSGEPGLMLLNNFMGI